MLALAGFAVVSASAQACTRTWSSGDGSWATSASWTPAGVPGPDDDVCITGAGTYTVTVPVLNGGAQVRSLTVGGSAGGTQTLAIVGQSTPLGGGTLSGSSLNASAGGTIAPTGRLVLDATDQGVPVHPGDQTGGPATLSGGAFTNNGSVVVQSESTQQFRDFLRVPFTNAAGGRVDVTTGFLDYTGGLTFENDGTLSAIGTGWFLLESDLPLNGLRTHMINTGSIAIDGASEVDNATWTQAGGSVTGRTLRMLNSALDYQSGTGSFDMSNRFATPGGSLSGTIPAGQTVIAEGGMSGDATDPNTMTLQLDGGQVVNRGTLVLSAVSGSQFSAGSASVQGAPLVNYGTILATSLPDYTGGNTLYPDLVRSDLTNEPGGVIDVESVLNQDAGTLTLNEGTVVLSGRGIYAVSRNVTAARASIFTNTADGTISARIDASSHAPWFLVEGDATFNAGGTLLPLLEQPFVPRQGREFQLVQTIGGSPLTGRFASVGGGFTADYTHAGYVGAIYGYRVGAISGGRGSASVTLVCPPAGPGCPKVTVQATAHERHRVTTGKGKHRRTHVSTRTVVVATGVGVVAAGRTSTFSVKLNRAGRRLLADSPGALVVRVVVTSNGRTLATKRVRVQRL